MEVDEIEKAGNITGLNLLPKKSRNRYEFTYDCFKKWCVTKNIDTVTEKVMLAYVLERSEQLKSSASLWCEYSMLKATINFNDTIDISKFPKLIDFLKSKNKGYQPKKSKILQREDILKFLGEAVDETYLLIKTVAIVGIAGACRSNEFCKMELHDITDHGNYVIIKIPQSKRGVSRSFTIVENPKEEIDYLKIFQKYYEIRKKLGVAVSPRFFMRYQNGKCFKQPVGKHTFAKMPATIAKFLGLPEANLYTGHCFRRSSATLLVNSGGVIFDLKKHKSNNSPKNYMENKPDVTNTNESVISIKLEMSSTST